MNIDKPIRILGMGKYLPRPVTSSRLEEELGIPTGCAERLSGVARRHWVESQSNSEIGAKAAQAALDDCGLGLSDVDLLISASATYDCPLPGQACLLLRRIAGGCKTHIPALDVGASCLSFVSALDVASQMLDGVRYRNILIVSAEISSQGVDRTDWKTASLFGDAAAAVVVTYDERSPSRILHGVQETYAEGCELAMVEGGGNRYHASTTPYDVKLHSFRMEGRQLLHLAARAIPPFFKRFFFGVGHQAPPARCRHPAPGLQGGPELAAPLTRL